MNRIYLILLLLTVLGGCAILWLLSSEVTRTGSNLSNLVGLMIPSSLGKGISHASYTSIIWLFGSAMMGLLGIIFSKTASEALNSKHV
jgi:hypothetical protein